MGGKTADSCTGESFACGHRAALRRPDLLRRHQQRQHASDLQGATRGRRDDIRLGVRDGAIRRHEHVQEVLQVRRLNRDGRRRADGRRKGFAQHRIPLSPGARESLRRGTRLHGVLAPRAKLRPRIVPRSKGVTHACERMSPRVGQNEPRSGRGNGHLLATRPAPSSDGAARPAAALAGSIVGSDVPMPNRSGPSPARWTESTEVHGAKRSQRLVGRHVDRIAGVSLRHHRAFPGPRCSPEPAHYEGGRERYCGAG
jgi:hypothetical protein